VELQPGSGVAGAHAGAGVSQRGLLIVGVFVSAWRPYRGVCEDLAAQLSECGSSLVTTSRKKSRFLRIVDMLVTTWRHRGAYAAAQVDVYSGWAFVWAEAVCRLLQWLKKPYILSLHGGNLPTFASLHPKRVRKLLNSAAAVTVPSGYLLSGLRDFREDVRLIPNPIAIERYPFRLRRPLQPRLIWLRAFHDLYEPVLAPRVLAQLLGDHPDATLTMVGPDRGDGSYLRTQSEAAHMGVANRVEFVGGVTNADVPRWLNLGDIFLNTARVDNTPVSVMEAMACGLCVVSTNVGGIPELLEDEQDALLVPVGDVPRMTAAVLRLLADGVLAERISIAARRKAERLDWKRILPLWTNLFESILPSGRG
jgi:glycosyltransferase involved in cell wall biosynthesis